MARKLGLLSGFALTKYSVNVSNILAPSECIRIDSLPVHSRERQFFIQFCKECWKAEHSPETAASIYLSAFYANGLRYLDGSVNSRVTVLENGSVVMSDAMVKYFNQQRAKQQA